MVVRGALVSKEKKIQIIPCGVALIRRGREFLISQRLGDDSFGGYWEFPGGKKDRGETLAACVVREAKEELDIKITVGRKLFDIQKKYHDRVVWLNFFLCSYVSGEPKALESQRVQWVDVLNLQKFKFPPANRIVIQKLKNIVLS